MYPSKQEPSYYAPPPPATIPYYGIPPPSTGVPVTAPPGTFQVQAAHQPTIGPWSTGLCDCCANPSNCCITCICPCITFGQMAEIIDRGSTSCGASGALYALLMFVPGCSCLYSCCYRGKLRAQFGLREAPCNDCLVHCCCECCSLCQMYRELSRRGFDMNIGWHGNMERQGHMAATMPPPAQGMTR